MRVSSFESFWQWHLKYFSLLVRLNYSGNTGVYGKVHVCLYVHRILGCALNRVSSVFSFNRHTPQAPLSSRFICCSLIFSFHHRPKLVVCFEVLPCPSVALSNLSFCIYRIAFVEIFPCLGYVLPKGHFVVLSTVSVFMWFYVYGFSLFFWIRRYVFCTRSIKLCILYSFFISTEKSSISCLLCILPLFDSRVPCI